jgi:RNA polymerase sigma-70 factor, ECF subfamily
MPPAAAGTQAHAMAAAETPALDVRHERDAALAVLLHEAATGNADAFEKFYDGTFGYAQALARRMLNRSDLDDVLAEAYLQVWREAARFDSARGSAVSWLLTIVRSRALDLLRRRRSMPEADGQELPADLPTEQSGPHEVLCAIQAGSALHHALSTLAAQERWLLALAYFRELTHAQISAQTGLPLGTVKSVILRAQGKLRQCLSGTSV